MSAITDAVNEILQRFDDAINTRGKEGLEILGKLRLRHEFICETTTMRGDREEIRKLTAEGINDSVMEGLVRAKRFQALLEENGAVGSAQVNIPMIRNSRHFPVIQNCFRNSKWDEEIIKGFDMGLSDSDKWIATQLFPERFQFVINSGIWTGLGPQPPRHGIRFKNLTPP